MADNHSSRELMACTACGAATVVHTSTDDTVGDTAHTCRRCGADMLKRLEDPMEGA